MPLLIRADSGPGIGAGHVMRCLALAQAWTAGPVRFVGMIDPPAIRARVEALGFATTRIEQRHPAPEDLLAMSRAIEQAPDARVVLDAYCLDAGYQRAIRARGNVVLTIDDTGERHAFETDLLLNQNLGAAALDYAGARGARLLLGPTYALIRTEFLTRTQPRPANERVERLLITFGGADPANVTEAVLEAWDSAEHPWRTATIAVGPAHAHRDALKRYDRPDRRVLIDPDMPSLYAEADLAIAAAGSTSWELAHAGVPAVLVVTADNQASIAAALAAAGAAVNAGAWPCVSATELLQTAARVANGVRVRAALARQASSLVDGQGAMRVASALEAARP